MVLMATDGSDVVFRICLCCRTAPRGFIQKFEPTRWFVPRLVHPKSIEPTRSQRGSVRNEPSGSVPFEPRFFIRVSMVVASLPALSALSALSTLSALFAGARADSITEERILVKGGTVVTADSMQRAVRCRRNVWGTLAGTVSLAHPHHPYRPQALDRTCSLWTAASRPSAQT